MGVKILVVVLFIVYACMVFASIIKDGDPDL